MKRDDYNRKISEYIGAMKEAKATTPEGCHRLCEHHENIIVTSALYVCYGLASDFAQALEQRAIERKEKDSYPMLGRRFLKSTIHTAAFRTLLLALLSAALAKGCNIELPKEITAAVATQEVGAP